jgi:hypothetical protein
MMSKLSLLVLSFLALYLTPEFKFKNPAPSLCEKLGPVIPKSSLVLRVINNSKNPHFNECLKSELEKNDVIVVADESIEKKLVHEMMKQSELPTKSESLIPIGEMLVPDHLLVIKKKKMAVFGLGLDIGLFEIKSGKVLYKDVFSFGAYELYAKEINNLLFSTALVFLYFLLLRLLNIPLLKSQIRRRKKKDSYSAFENARTLIQKGNLHDGVEAMMNVAKDQISGGASSMALKHLKKIKPQMEIEK